MKINLSKIECSFCHNFNTNIIQQNFFGCDDCKCIFKQNFNGGKLLLKNKSDNNTSKDNFIKKIVKMRFWDVIASYCIQYLKTKTDMKFKTALDVGALYGHLVTRLNELGIDACGIEVDKKFISEQITNKIIHDYFDENYKTEKKFDLVCLTQMIYYVKDPFNVIKKATEILNPESGLLFISTQNPSSSVFRNNELTVFEEDMNIILSKKNFEDIASKLKMKLIDYTTFKPNIYVDRLKNQSMIYESINFFKYYLKNPYETDYNGHHSFILLSKDHYT